MERYPEVVISAVGEEYLKRGQMWMYRNNQLSASPEAADGGIVRVVNGQGAGLGVGFYSAVSHIAVRLLSRDLDTEVAPELFRERIRAAYRFRQAVARDNLADCRLIYGESDQLPGLVVDRYNDILVAQISCAGIEQRRELIYRLIREVLAQDGQKITAVYERNDLKAREKEGLPGYKGFFGPAAAEQTVIDENGVKMLVDVANGQKTGYFLDQKENRLLVRKLAYGKRVLDCFSHTGGFALNAARGRAAAVTAVDLSAAALAVARENARLNGLEGRIRLVQDDVFDFLEKCRPADYDLIILDPPAFAKDRGAEGHAYNGYKRLNRQAMELLRGGRYLATCSCSRYIEAAEFEKMLREAAGEAGVLLKQVSVSQQAPDHPIIWTMDSTAYLKFYIFQII